MEADERLLRIAVFSDTLQLLPTEGVTRSLSDRRKSLAISLREMRKKGVVPVFVSLAWFLFALGISIQSALGQIGKNTTAHDLALGLLLAWLPVFVIATIVDRNPVGPDRIRRKINQLLDNVRAALLDPVLRETYRSATGRTEEDFAWTHALESDDLYDGFFTKFAGQGRLRWHHGVAHSILTGSEIAYISRRGRNWMRDAERAKTAWVVGPENIYGLLWFDLRMIWQILSSIVVVGGTIGGAFILSCEMFQSIRSHLH